jgi:hypothetical protein
MATVSKTGEYFFGRQVGAVQRARKNVAEATPTIAEVVSLASAEGLEVGEVLTQFWHGAEGQKFGRGSSGANRSLSYNRAMRIKGVPLEEAAPNVRRLYQNTTERLGRVTIPLTAFAHCPEIAEAYSALGAALARDAMVEPWLKTLACVRTAQIVGCPF